METKVCIKCNIEKKINSDNFHKEKRCKDGYRNVCRECINARYRELNKIGSPRFERKKERMRQYMKNKRATDPLFGKKERVRKKTERKDPLTKKQINRRKYERRKERMKTDSEYREKMNRKVYERRKRKMKNDLVYRLKIKLRKKIRKSLTNNGYTKNSKTYDILGCSYKDFKIYIESQFENWMNWDNYGLYNGKKNYGWDFDHIVPLSSAKCEEDIIKLNHHTNIQPLCSYVNRYIKKDNINYNKNELR